MTTLSNNDNDYTVTTNNGERVEANRGDDTVRGAGGNDTLLGQRGEDQLFGEGGNDTLDGGNDSDYIEGGSGDDSIRGEGGNDTIKGDSGNDNIEGGDGNDSIEGGTDDDTIKGGGASDKLYGDAGQDNIEGDDGNDTIDGGDNADKLFGEVGNDSINGGSGNDTIGGGTNSDKLFGDAGDDRIEGDDGDDTIEGGADDDKLYGEAGNDSIDGGTGNDTIEGNDGRDKLFGGDNADEIDGGSGDDSIEGGDGHDLLRGGVGTDTLKGGAGNDTIRGQENQDTIYGGDGFDLIYGGDEEDVIYTNDDELRDIIYAGFGKDILHVQGNDVAYGEPGDDIIYVHMTGDGGGGGRIEGNLGADQVDVYLYDDVYYTSPVTLKGGAAEEDREGTFATVRSPDSDSIVYNPVADEGIAAIRSISGDGDKRVVAADADLEFDWTGYFDNDEKLRAEFKGSNFETNTIKKTNLSGTVIGDSSINLNSAINEAPVASSIRLEFYEGATYTGSLLDYVTDDDAFSSLVDLQFYESSFANISFASDGTFTVRAQDTTLNDDPDATPVGSSAQYYVSDGIEVSSGTFRAIFLNNELSAADDSEKIVTRALAGDTTTTLTLNPYITNPESDQPTDITRLSIRKESDSTFETFDVTDVGDEDLDFTFDGGTFRKPLGTTFFFFEFGDVSEDYVITYEVTDGILTDTGAVDITFNDRPEAPDYTHYYRDLTNGKFSFNPFEQATDANGDTLTPSKFEFPTVDGETFTFNYPIAAGGAGLEDTDYAIVTGANDGTITIDPDDLLSTDGVEMVYTVSDGRSTATGTVTLEYDYSPEADDVTVTVPEGRESFKLFLADNFARDENVGQDLSINEVRVTSADGNTVLDVFRPLGDLTKRFAPEVAFNSDGSVTFADTSVVGFNDLTPIGFTEDVRFEFDVTDGTTSDTGVVSVVVDDTPDVSDADLLVEYGTNNLSLDLVGDYATDADSTDLTVTEIRLLSPDGTSVQKTFTPDDDPGLSGLQIAFEDDGSVRLYNPTLVFNPDGGPGSFVASGLRSDLVLEFDVSDGRSAGTGVLTIDVNREPEVTDVTVDVASGGSLTIDLLGDYASDPDGDPLTVTTVRLMSSDGSTTQRTFNNGVDDAFTGGLDVDFLDDGQIKISDRTIINLVDENGDFAGFGTQGIIEDLYFEYDVSDGKETSTGILRVQPNTAPVADDDVFAVPNGATSVIVDPLANDTDDDGDALTITEVRLLAEAGGAVTGTATFTGDGEQSATIGDITVTRQADGQLAFQRDGGFSTDLWFAYDVSDGFSEASAEFQLDTNAPPVVSTADPAPYTENDTSDVVTFNVSDQVTASDPDPGDTPVVDATTIAVAAAAGSDITDTSLISVDPANGNLSFDRAAFNTLAVGEQAAFVVSFDVVSGDDTVPQSFRLTINGENDLPVASTENPLPFDESDTSDLVSFNILDFVTFSDADATDTLGFAGNISVAAAPGSATTDTSAIVFAKETDDLISFDRGAFNALGAGESAIYTVDFELLSKPENQSSADVIQQSLTLTIDGENDAPVVSTTDPAALTESDTSDIVTLGVADYVNASDADEDDTPAVDATTIAVAAAAGSDITDTSLISVDPVTGDIAFDRAAFNGLGAGEAAVYTVSFDVVSGGDVVPQSFTLTIDGENDAPILTSLSNSMVPESEFGAIIGDLTTVDVDLSDSHTYQVTEVRDGSGQAVSSPFEIVDGTLKVKDDLSLDFETISHYQVDVTTTDRDGAGLSISNTFDITVEDQNFGAGWGDGFENVGLHQWYNPKWGGGYIATFTYTLEASDVLEGSVSAWTILPNYTGPGEVKSGWLNGFNAPVRVGDKSGEFSLSTVDKRYQKELEAGDQVTFSLLVRGSAYDEDHFAFSFSDDDEPIAPPSDPVSSSDYEIRVEVLSSWKGGSAVEFYLKNTSDETIQDIDDLQFQFTEPDAHIKQTWGVSAENDVLDVSPWSPGSSRGDLDPGNEIKVGGFTLLHDRRNAPTIDESDFILIA